MFIILEHVYLGMYIRIYIFIYQTQKMQHGNGMRLKITALQYIFSIFDPYGML